MVKGLYQYLREKFKKPDIEELRKKMIDWRASGVFARVERPTNLARARSLGYKAKRGVVIIRVKVNRGGHKKPKPNAARRTKRTTIRMTLKMNYQWIAEQKVARRYPNLEVLNSYKVGKDGNHYFFEVICVDPSKPEIKSDKELSKIGTGANKKRAQRGITSFAQKSRGLRNKHPTSKIRPSVRAGKRLGK